MVWLKTGWLAMMAAASVAAVEFHVAPRGSATGTGSADFPFGTLERAREAVAEAKRQGLGAEGITVWVHGGRYERRSAFFLGPADGGVVYRNAPGEVPVLSGAQPLPLDAFARVRDPEVLNRLPESARRSVRVANLRAFQITDYGEFPVHFRGGVPVLEMYCDGERMELARWPNAPDWTAIGRIVDRGSVSGEPGPARPGTFRYADPRHERWTTAPDAYLNGYWCFDWFDEAIRIGKIDPQAGTVTLAAPHGYGVGRAHTVRRYYAFNLLEELDASGEYYLDRAQGLLYFWPPTRAKGPVDLTMLAEPVIQVVGCNDVRIEGLTVEEVRQGGIEVRDSSRVTIAGCTVRHTGTYGISVSGGSDCRVDTCDIYDTGAGGILLSGGDRRSLTPCNHRATNNHIHHFARRQRTYAGGIHLDGVGLRADHNLIHDAPHSAILCGANDCVIEYNEVHDVCLETDDCGAFYKGRNPARQGNVLRYNFWHHIGTALGHGNNAIYFDDGDVGETVFGNVFYQAGRNSGGSMGAIFTHGGHANTFVNNLFIDCDRAIGHSHWTDERWRDYFDPAKNAFMKQRLLEEVDITKPPYSDRYPSLHDFFNSWQRPRLNIARDNVAVRCGDFLSGEEYHDAQDNLELTDDPGFVNAKAMNFLLKPDSPVFAQLPDFQPIPFALIGLKRSPLRAEWPVAHLPAKRVVPKAVEIPPIPLDEFAVAPGTAPTIDGTLKEGEWEAPGMPLPVKENLQGGRARFPARAWLRCDHENLYVAFEVFVSPEKPMVLGDQWGRCDAVEIAVAQGNQPIAVLRGYPTGHSESSTEASKDEAAAQRAGLGVRYAATVPGANRWLCEWGIPWTSLGLKPQAGATCNFNLSIRQTATDEWTMLRATGGSTWKVSEAAILRLAATPQPPPPVEPVPVSPAQPAQPEVAVPTPEPAPVPVVEPAKPAPQEERPKPVEPALVAPQPVPAQPAPVLKPVPVLESPKPAEPAPAPAVPKAEPPKPAEPAPAQPAPKEEPAKPAEPVLVPPQPAPVKPAPVLKPVPVLEPPKPAEPVKPVEPAPAKTEPKAEPPKPAEPVLAPPQPVPAKPAEPVPAPPAPKAEPVKPAEPAPAKTEPKVEPPPPVEPVKPAEPELVPPQPAPAKPAPVLKPVPVLEPEPVEEPEKEPADKPKFRFRMPWNTRAEEETKPVEPTEPKEPKEDE